MEIEKKAGLGFAALAGIGALTAIGSVIASRRRRTAPAGLAGTWSGDVEKLAAKGETSKKGVIISWALPPGPVPAADSTGARAALRQICNQFDDKRGLYQGGSGKGALAKLREKTGGVWHYGTCPGCSEQCSRACYVAKTTAHKFGSQRMMWGNVCDVVNGKGLPEIREDTCAAGRLRTVDRPCGKVDAIALVGRPEDPDSKDLVVDTKRLDSAYVRVHVSGDFFDRDYTKAWLDHARKAVARYKREYAAWQAGTRRDPPLRVHYWGYTRSWRLQDPKRRGRPDPHILDIIREFPTLMYPAEYWPAWAGENAGKLRRPPKQTFAVLLSADSSTGIPWVKDKRGRIMPVSFVLTESDLTTIDESGRPVVADWDKKVPGVVLRDHSLRTYSKAKTEDWASGKGQFWCPMEDPAKSVEEKERVGGCFNCRLCLPETSQNVAEVMFKRYTMGWPDGESFALMEAAKRGSPLNWYEEWQRRGPVFMMATQPVTTNFKPATAAARERIRIWQEQKLHRLPLVGE